MESKQELPASPAAGEGRIWDGSKWLEVAPSMEGYAVVRLQKENEAKEAALIKALDALTYYSSPESHATTSAWKAPLSERYLNDIQMNDRGRRANEALTAINEVLS